jgi:DNA repair protein SbcC/Rad50
MKILDIRFKNLNSLTGEWHIDFTHPDYLSDGIFAIIGPTGSGKTTILDAICLGLYGRTPRLEKVTKSTNEIMSRQAGECYAEVTFETQKGRYRCHWSQRRARKKPDGELQPARHEIADVHSDKVLESKITHVEELVEKVTGMDFDRFTRSMLLAQGGFAAFLQAPPDKRAPILEQITGTEIYSHISIKVHEKNREESEKLDLLQSELKGIRILNENEESELQAGLKEKQSREVELTKKLDVTRKALSWAEGILALTKELDALDKKSRDFEERRKAFKPEAEKLEKSRKALSIDGDYKETVALRRQQDADAKELDGSLAIMPEKGKASAEALTARQGAEIGLNEARTKQASEADTIKKVREFDARLSEKKHQVEETDKAIANIGMQVKTYKDSIEKTGLILKQSQKDLKVVNDYITKHAVDSTLLTNLTAIGKSFATLNDIEAKHLKACENMSIAAGKKEAAIVDCKKIETDHENLRKEFEKNQSELKRLTDESSAILKGREISQCRNELDVLRERSRLLDQAGDIIGRIGTAEKTLKNLATSLKTSKDSHEKILDEIKSAIDKKVLLERNIENMEIQVSLMSRIRDLEEDRKRLEDGKACPLCGATDHPYAKGNVPELNKAEAVLKKTKTEFKKESEKLSKLETDQAKQATEIKHVEKDIAGKTIVLNSDNKQFTDTLQVLKITVVAEERAAKVREELAVVQKLIVEVSGIVASAEEKSKKEKSAQVVLEKVRVKVENSSKALQEAKFKLESAGSEHARLVKECDDHAKQIEKARGDALKDVELFGIEQIQSVALDAILKDLTQRKKTWEMKQTEKAVYEKKINELKAGIDKDSALFDSLEKDLIVRGKERDELMLQYESLCASRRELFGDGNPDQEEKRLADTVEQAGKALEKTREQYEKIEREINALKEKMDLLKGNIERRARELVEVEKNLKDKIKRSGFEDEADFLSSCLPEEEREILVDKEKSMIKEKTEIDARSKDRSEALVLERNKNLTDQPSEELKESLGVCESDMKQIRHDIGGITNSLNENEKQKKQQQERIKSIEDQKKEYMRWDALHQLIGSADGKKFRNFAQGLTFEMMTTHANRQLSKMTDRYLLVRDSSEPLELNVIDNYQAGEIRSTKNLSGGETFIVSLALALGLSRMASQNVRVDSLFLDEGFGTLDDDALETALDTLAELQQDGKLIGVISHVPALKERISTQIQVIPETGGRSFLSGPGCQKI